RATRSQADGPAPRPKNGLVGARDAAYSAGHERLWTILPDRSRVRDLCRAVDSADPARAPGRRPQIQRGPSGPADDLAHTSGPTAARARGRRRRAEPAAQPGTGA